jgi:hypothetical protein
MLSFGKDFLAEPAFHPYLHSPGKTSSLAKMEIN